MKRVLALSASALALSACTLEPRYQRPDAPIPQAFPQGGVYPTAQAGATTPTEVDWEIAFRDPKLQGLIRTALVQNRDLRATVANVRAAHAQFQVTRSQLFPTIAAGGGVTWARTPLDEVASSGAGAAAGGGAVTTGSTSGGHFDSRTITADVGVSAWEIDLFGRLRSLSKEGFEQYLASSEGARAAKLSLVAEVASGYLTLAADRSLQAVSEQTVKSGSETLRITEARFKGGVASAVDVRQAQSIVQQAQADDAARAIAVAQDRNALDLLVGSPVPDDQLPATLADTMPTFAEVPAGLNSSVLLDRPDVLQAEHTLRAANADIGAARAAFFPAITLTGSAGQTSTNLSSLFKGANSFWSAGPSVSLPLFAGGRNVAGLRLSKAQRDAAVATYESTVQGAFRDVANALAEQGGSVAQLSAEQALVDTSNDALRLSTARYRQGSDTYLNVLDAQRTLYTAQQALVGVQLTRTSNLVTLFKALGGRVR